MNIHIPHDLEIPLLGMYPRGILEHTYPETYTRMLITAKNKTKKQKQTNKKPPKTNKQKKKEKQKPFLF